MKYPKYFSLKMNREKSIFNFEKQNLEPVGNSVHTTEYLAFGKALLARLYLKVKVCITKCIYNFKKCVEWSNFAWTFTSELENLPLLDIEWTLVL